jgi:hypothetical protein
VHAPFRSRHAQDGLRPEQDSPNLAQRATMSAQDSRIAAPTSTWIVQDVCGGVGDDSAAAQANRGSRGSNAPPLRRVTS